MLLKTMLVTVRRTLAKNAHLPSFPRGREPRRLKLDPRLRGGDNAWGSHLGRRAANPWGTRADYGQSSFTWTPSVGML